MPYNFLKVRRGAPNKTRMYSSRMRTGRSLTVCCSLLPGGVLPARGGSPWSGGVLPTRGGFSLVPGGSSPCQGGVCLVRGGGSPCQGSFPWSRGGGSPCQGGGGCLPGLGGFSLPGGICLVWGGLESPSPPVYRITDTCKNITLAITSLRPVMI